VRGAAPLQFARAARAACALAARVAVVVSIAGAARADGAFPDSLSIVAPVDRPHHIALATNFGLISSNDDGGSWSWVCEGPLTNCSTLYSESAAPVDRLYALSADSLVFSDDDACEWTVAGGDVSAGGVVDAFPLAQDARRVLAVVSPNGVGPQTTYTVVESDDGGASFGTVIYTATGGDTVTGVEVSRSDASTIYVTLASGPRFAPALAITVDGGAHWRGVDLSTPLGASSGIRLVAVDRATPTRVFLRVSTLEGEELGVFDATTGAVTKPLMFPGGLMTAFLQTAEGPLIAAGRLPGGGVAARSLDGGVSFQPTPGAPNARALAERDGTIYVAADDTADGYALGVSTDLGVTFTPLMRFDQVGSIAACVRASCQTICMGEAAAGLWPASMCTATPEAACTPTPETVCTPTPETTPKASGGGGCDLAPGPPGPGAFGLGLGLLTAAGLRRRWPRRSSSSTRRRRREDRYHRRRLPAPMGGVDRTINCGSLLQSSLDLASPATPIGAGSRRR
jgi:hypothetical protein